MDDGEEVKVLQEIRWHGRGGNGAFTAAKLLGMAAALYEGKSAQAFPSFGPERRGAPVVGFTRIAEENITDHSQIYDCDCIVVLDETLCGAVDITKGLKQDGLLIINTAEPADSFRDRIDFKNVNRLLTIDATRIALEVLKTPIVNTVLLGAVIGASSIISLESLDQAIDTMMGETLRGRNKRAARIAYDRITAKPAEGGANG